MKATFPKQYLEIQSLSFLFFQVSYPPYIFECLLYAPVDDRNSTAQVGNGTVIFKMLKQELGKWERLQSEHAGTVKATQK